MFDRLGRGVIKSSLTLLTMFCRTQNIYKKKKVVSNSKGSDIVIGRLLDLFLILTVILRLYGLNNTVLR